MINPLEQTNKTIMVTGASSGIGRVTCQLIDQLGGKVVLVGRNEKTLLETKLETWNGFIEPFDLSKVNEIESWFDGVHERVGPLSGIVHCAGIQSLTPLKMLDINEAENLFKVNVSSGLVLAKCFRKRGYHDLSSNIVFVSSVMGHVGAGFRSAYCASKGAVIAMTKSLAIELAKENIKVNCVAPGCVKTEMLSALSFLIGEESIKGIEKQHPLGFGEPEDVANAIVFLLSSEWITGTTLFVDGGYTAQ